MQQPFLRLAARALRIAKQCAKDPCWTIWKPLELNKVFQQRLGQLRFDPACKYQCKCGRAKDPISFIKCDAA
eukprot:9327301-Pyramimonas_sp.AAC.1